MLSCLSVRPPVTQHPLTLCLVHPPGTQGNDGMSQDGTGSLLPIGDPGLDQEC